MPHERTLAGPKADRLKLLQAAEANLSSVFLLYEDSEDALSEYLLSAFGPNGELIGSATDDGGVEYELARLSDPDSLAAIEAFLAERSCVIADGHHRYETALEYRRLRRLEGEAIEGEAPFDSTLAYFANAYAPGSLLLPIHRVVRNKPVPTTHQWETGLPGWTRNQVEAKGEASDVAVRAMELLASHEGEAAFVADAGDGFLQVFYQGHSSGRLASGPSGRGGSPGWRIQSLRRGYPGRRSHTFRKALNAQPWMYVRAGGRWPCI